MFTQVQGSPKDPEIDAQWKTGRTSGSVGGLREKHQALGKLETALPYINIGNLRGR